MKSTWLVRDRNDQKVLKLAETLSLDQDLISILFSRGLQTEPDILEFLNPELYYLPSPFLLRGVPQAVIRLKKAILQKEKIGIFADSDLDGITSLVLLHNLFSKMEIDFCYRYPKDDEDYGLSEEIINEFYQAQVSLVITVDSGIKDVKEVSLGKQLGLDFIITDHHEQGDEVPETIIVNPKQNNCPYPFKDLAGVGVAFRLSQALLFSFLPAYEFTFIIISPEKNFFNLAYLHRGQVVKIERNILSSDLKNFITKETDRSYVIIDGDKIFLEQGLKDFFPKEKIYSLQEFAKLYFSLEQLNEEKLTLPTVFKDLEMLGKWFLGRQIASSPKIVNFNQSVLGLVALGTIADVMPLIEDNRILVTQGLHSLNCLENNISSSVNKIFSGEKITAKDVSWRIAPFLNSPGRFGQSDFILDFFLAKEPKEIEGNFKKIESFHERRKNLLEELYQNLLLSTNNFADQVSDNLLFIKSGNIPEGFCGLLANKLTSLTNKPVIVTSVLDSDGFVKGSGRSNNRDFNWFEILDPFKSIFNKLGGHAQAFGFRIKAESLAELEENFKESLTVFSEDDSQHLIDLEINLEQVNFELMDKISRIAPFGKENPEIVLMSKGVKIKSFSSIGQGNKHGLYKFLDNPFLQGIGWNLYAQMEKKYLSKKKLDLIYKLEVNEFRGKKYLRMVILDLEEKP